MKLLHDKQLTLLTRVYAYRGSYHLCATAMLGFRLKQSVKLLSEDELWDTAAGCLGQNELLDAGMPKPKGEVLVACLCHTDGNRPVDVTQAGFRVGSLAKSIAVFGDRYWLGSDSDQKSAPKTFTVMPVDWQHAFGGVDFPANPLGKGRTAISMTDGRLLYPLPNIEYPGDLINFRKDAPSPAGLGPKGMDWPGRTEQCGTFDNKWLSKSWPGLPDDFDFGIFNLASVDQRLSGYFKGGEELEIIRLMPDMPHLKTQLPTQRLRFFICRHPSDSQWVELKANLDTVWLLPETDAGILIWHAISETGDDEASDIARIMAVHEPIQSHPVPPCDHETRLSGTDEAVTEEAAPPLPPHAVPEPPTSYVQGAVSEVSKAGLTAATAVIAGTATAFGASEVFKQDAARDTLQEMEAKTALFEQQLREQLVSSGIDPDQPTALTEPPPAIMQQMQTDPDLPPEQQIARLEQNLKELFARHGINPDDPPAIEQPKIPTVAETLTMLRTLPGDNSELIRNLEELEAEKVRLDSENQELLKQMEQQQAEQQKSADDPAANTKTEPSIEAEQVDPGTDSDIKNRLANGKGLAGMDLSNRDLRGYLLAGVDLSSANLQQSEMTGMNLTGAILCSANLSNARLKGANLTQANLSKAILQNADLSEANLHKADLTLVQAGNARIVKADISEADLSGAVMQGVNAGRCKVKRASFNRADLTDACLVESSFESVNFTESNLTRADFSMADLQNADFSKADANSACFVKACMKAASSDGETNFKDARLTGADLRQTFFEASDFSRADFSHTNMEGSSFIHCKMEKINLSHADAIDAEFRQCDMQSARMAEINLMNGSLLKSNLYKADLGNSNLFAVDLLETRIDGANLKGANIKRTLTTAKTGKTR